MVVSSRVLAICRIGMWCNNAERYEILENTLTYFLLFWLHPFGSLSLSDVYNIQLKNSIVFCTDSWLTIHLFYSFISEQKITFTSQRNMSIYCCGSRDETIFLYVLCANNINMSDKDITSFAEKHVFCGSNF